VSEAELRTRTRPHLGEQENLTPGLSAASRSPSPAGGTYDQLPGASQPDWTFTVTGRPPPVWESNPQLRVAVQGYAGYVKQNTADLVSTLRRFASIDAKDMNQAKALYPPARVYYGGSSRCPSLGQPGHQHRRQVGRTRSR